MKFGVSLTTVTTVTTVTAVAASVLSATAGCAKEVPVAPAPKVTPPKVMLGGQDLNVSPPVTCAKSDHTVTIAIGQAPTVLSAVVSDADQPQLKSVVFDTVNGEILVYRAGSNSTPQGTTVSRNGNSYSITGNAAVLDSGTPPATKDFKIEAVCP